ncbi:MAG TPA: lysophospholipid acyltransferase family protein [Blastocatellia bacterium]|nr:lysophospholipid acyltransferase family protein [Blastocatellia bacterium]
MMTDDPPVSLEIPEGEAKAPSGDPRARPRTGEKKRSRVAHATDPEQVRRRVYEFSDLSGYKWSDRLLIRAADVFFYLLIRVICSTLRWEARGREHLDAVHASGRRAIYTFWHSCIFSATWAWRGRGIVVMSSNSRDAEYIGRFIKRLGYGTARGSATRGGGRALAEMSECLGHGIDVAFTIDGPRGPAYVAKAGAVTLARHSGQAILPFHVASSSYWTLPSWDRLQIPRPFTRAVTMIGEPIYVSREDSPEEVSAKQELLQATLDRLCREGEEAVSGR